jgi:hypothetical protein
VVRGVFAWKVGRGRPENGDRSLDLSSGPPKIDLRAGPLSCALLNLTSKKKQRSMAHLVLPIPSRCTHALRARQTIRRRCGVDDAGLGSRREWEHRRLTDPCRWCRLGASASPTDPGASSNSFPDLPRAARYAPPSFSSAHHRAPNRRRCRSGRPVWWLRRRRAPSTSLAAIPRPGPERASVPRNKRVNPKPRWAPASSARNGPNGSDWRQVLLQ